MTSAHDRWLEPPDPPDVECDICHHEVEADLVEEIEGDDVCEECKLALPDCPKCKETVLELEDCGVCFRCLENRDDALPALQ